MLKQLGASGALLGRVIVLGSKVLTRAIRVGPLATHQSQTEASYLAAKTKILILGSGFGGLATALNLDKSFGADPDTSILVVDRNNYQLFHPLLWTVADGRANASSVVVPVRALQRGRSFHVLHAEIERIDLENRTVHTSAGSRPYDVLVIALGSVTSIPALPGLRENALLFHSPANAMELRNHLIDAIEAAHQTTDPAESQAWLTFVIGGGGDTGIELAATVHAYLVNGLFARYPWLANMSVRIVIIGRAERLVPMSDEKTSQAVRQVLEAQGIEVLTGVAINGATDHSVLTSQGEIPTHTLFWAAGITAPPVIQELPVKKAPNGALLVNENLQLPDHSEVYVVGDAAWVMTTSAPLPPTAQAAEHEGAYIARAITGQLKNKPVPSFRFKPKGHLALLGSHTGVGEVGSLMFKGLPAWFLWHAYYLSHIPSWRNRFQLLIGWVFAAVLGRETTQLRLGQHDPK